MASENKYSAEIVIKSGDRVLTTVNFPNQSYIDVVGLQAVISNALVSVGLETAKEKGDEIPPALAKMFGLGNS